MRAAVKVTSRLLVIVVALAAAALVAVLVVVPRVSGSTPLTVLTGSMTPTIPAGSVVLVKPVDPMTLQPGDIITFQAAPGVERFVTHRVVRFQPDTTPPSYITKGDANRGEDSDPVPVGAIRGEVWLHVPYIGQAAELVHGPRGWGMLGALGGVLLLMHVVGQLLGGRRTDDAMVAVSA